jgi:AraC-like DNA-binding protein
MALSAVYEQLARRERLGSVRSGPDAAFHAGLETHRAGERYFWDGIRRSTASHAPFALFQATLDGAGVYEDARGSVAVGPGRAFLTIVPSEHRYYLPDDPAAHWTFFWVLIRHPYIVARIAARYQGGGEVRGVAPESLLLARAATLCAGGFRDLFDEELALFAFLLEIERTRAGGTGLPLEDDVRAYAQQHLDRPLDVIALARRYGLSRSRFSHRFKALTGTTPARFLLAVRLEEAAHRLAQTDDGLARIAAATGFADSNHLVKAFRRHYHTTPGAFRRQLRG